MTIRPLISSNTLSKLRTIKLRSMDKTAVVMRNNGTARSLTGAVSAVWQAVAQANQQGSTSVPAFLSRYQNEKPIEEEIFSKLGSRQAWYISMPVGTDVTAADLVVIDGQSYDILGVLNGQSFQVSVDLVAATTK